MQGIPSEERERREKVIHGPGRGSQRNLPAGCLHGRL